jgi:hypothetical protein
MSTSRIGLDPKVPVDSPLYTTNTASTDVYVRLLVVHRSESCVSRCSHKNSFWVLAYVPYVMPSSIDLFYTTIESSLSR